MLLKFKYFKKVYFSLGVILALILVGSGGFMHFEGCKFHEAFFGTIIAISTVSFGEVVGELGVARWMFPIMPPAK